MSDLKRCDIGPNLILPSLKGVLSGLKDPLADTKFANVGLDRIDFIQELRQQRLQIFVHAIPPSDSRMIGPPLYEVNRSISGAGSEEGAMLARMSEPERSGRQA